MLGITALGWSEFSSLWDQCVGRSSLLWEATRKPLCWYENQPEARGDAIAADKDAFCAEKISLACSVRVGLGTAERTITADDPLPGIGERLVVLVLAQV